MKRTLCAGFVGMVMPIRLPLMARGIVMIFAFEVREVVLRFFGY
ncbi:MAG TPA: hypothetical protein VK327_13270 [Candidatus Paceibacterota bacterium]|nr:hypothetical protein [Candidatus Paceibacterota bacterium]